MRIFDSGKNTSEAFDEYRESLIVPSDPEREAAFQHIGVLNDKS